MMSYHFNNSLLQYEHTNSTDTYTITSHILAIKWRKYLVSSTSVVPHLAILSAPRLTYSLNFILFHINVSKFKNRHGDFDNWASIQSVGKYNYDACVEYGRH